MKVTELGRLGFIAIVLIMIGGCAINRGILDVQLEPIEDPKSDKIVTIARVTDVRQFEAAPKSANVPSLKYEWEINDKNITSRAIARKRGGFGKAMGDILLPEGQTVENLVKAAVTKAFREKGYSVVESDSGVVGSIPLEIDIEQFWAWFTPGMWVAGLSFEGSLRIKGNIPSFENGDVVKSTTKLHTQAARTGAWMNTIQKGLQDLIEKIKQRI